jgi:hypothetical protein
VEEIRIEPAVQEVVCCPPEPVEDDDFCGSICLGWLAVGLYIISFFLPAYAGALGYQAFLCALVCMIGIPMWSANLVFWGGLAQLSQGRYRSAGGAGLAALLLALSEAWMFRDGLQVGYWMWVGSMGLLALAGLCPERETRPRRLHVRSAALPVGEAYRIASRFRGAESRRLGGSATPQAAQVPCQSGDGVESKYTANEANQCSPT